MCDLNWCPVCDKAIHPSLSTLYCSDECLQYDALNRHPLLGYNFAEFKGFLRNSTKRRASNHYHGSHRHDSHYYNNSRCHSSDNSSIHSNSITSRNQIANDINGNDYFPPPLLYSATSTDDEEEPSPALTPKSALAVEHHSRSPPTFKLGKSACHYDYNGGHGDQQVSSTFSHR